METWEHEEQKISKSPISWTLWYIAKSPHLPSFNRKEAKSWDQVLLPCTADSISGRSITNLGESTTLIDSIDDRTDYIHLPLSESCLICRPQSFRKMDWERAKIVRRQQGSTGMIEVKDQPQWTILDPGKTVWWKMIWQLKGKAVQFVWLLFPWRSVWIQPFLNLWIELMR